MTRASIRTPADHPSEVAAALRPDNTDEMDTRIEDGTVVTTIERGDADGLRSTIDDYVVNLDVAIRVADIADQRYETEP